MNSENTSAPVFPYGLPKTKPDIPLSRAMERLYTQYPAPTTWWNKLFTLFRYTPLEGLDYHNHDGTLTRRDPSKVIKVNSKYYTWYTRRASAVPPRGPGKGTDDIPSTDWDLAEIWYATSKDGFVWEEQGLAVPRPPKPIHGWRSVCTPDILVWKGRYYLYYQSFVEMSGKRGDFCAISASWADSPDGPWTPTNKVIVPTGPEGAWDQYSVQGPCLLVYKGRIHFYYKANLNGRVEPVCGLGLAIADDPLGPWEKHPLNPVVNSGHETAFFPYKEGIAALVIRDGNEHNTIQFAPDGVHFEVASSVSLMPIAPAPYVPDAFTDTDDGRGITWGLCHFTTAGTKEGKCSIMARFDCCLSQDHEDAWSRQREHWWPPEFYFYSGLDEQSRRQREEAARADLGS